jgi:hypothetical protein
MSRYEQGVLRYEWDMSRKVKKKVNVGTGSVKEGIVYVRWSRSLRVGMIYGCQSRNRVCQGRSWSE